MQISYSTGWNIIRTMESQFSRSLIERSQGGAGGGQSRLTEDGRALVEAFNKYSSELRRVANELFQSYFEDSL
jgi:molybdate transport system regulatory protein